MKLILSLDIVEFGKEYTFTIHHNRCATTFKANTIPGGLDRVARFLEEKEAESVAYNKLRGLNGCDHKAEGI